jgi:hypothetical protein
MVVSGRWVGTGQTPPLVVLGYAIEPTAVTTLLLMLSGNLT